MFLEDCATLYNPERVKVLDGIAGSGKSSKLDKIFKDTGVSYYRFTSTNKLKRDALERYGGHADTIAGGLFNTEQGSFFSSKKDLPAGSVVVIDEILQTDRRVLDWIEENRGACNIFVLTDTHQMLAPVHGGSFLEAFRRFKARDFVDVIDMPETLRARDTQTKEIYKKCFDSVDVDRSLYYEHVTCLPHVAFADLEYHPGDVYITHTKADEKALYNRFDLSQRYDLDLIPKGSIARKPPKSPEKYPILPQLDVTTRLYGYYQIANIGTPTRYQGSECKDNQTLYFLAQPGARVEAREWYTVVTRAYHFSSIKIVDMPKQEHAELRVYFNSPVKTTNWVELPVSDELSEKIGSEQKPRISREDMQVVLKDIKDTEDTHYRAGGFKYDGKLVLTQKEEDAPQKVSMSGLLTKEPCFSYGFMPDFYKRYEYIQSYTYGSVFSYLPGSTTIKTRDWTLTQGEYMYGLDLCASYPHILANCKLPIDGEFVTDDEAEDSQQDTSDTAYSFATVVDSKYIPDGAIISVETVLKLQDMEDTGKFLWVGTSRAKRGSLMGERLLGMSTDCKETNEIRKQVRYGLAERAFLSGCEYDGKGTPTAYAIEEKQNHAPLMWAIKDAQARAMLTIYEQIYGHHPENGYTLADCLYFNFYGDIKKLGEKLHKLLPEFDFRIFRNSEEDKHANIIYQTYPDLETRTEKQARIRREKAKARKAQKA